MSIEVRGLKIQSLQVQQRSGVRNYCSHLDKPTNDTMNGLINWILWLGIVCTNNPRQGQGRWRLSDEKLRDPGLSCLSHRQDCFYVESGLAANLEEEKPDLVFPQTQNLLESQENLVFRKKQTEKWL